ncbi:PRC-barrel domain containing protein [Georhizobium profundi]|jgi:ribosomal 30S subunit maturation factor RimM|uniref:PRC-barrel domain containing protein n=1 Tax=Georhizobium profundi TaxID=2341112 RepID=A0A3Q8XR03_9HYPH|nr:PRC-barrel domain-containing protein [Georhizobium profundi]AZN73299.1 PRC-barrel domain containing protein [Georhizobium profundi]
MDKATDVRLIDMEITRRNLKGARVYGANDEAVGTIVHLHGVGPNSQVVIDIGGFLGFGSKSVVVPARDLDIMRDENGDVFASTNLTEVELKEMPEHQEPGKPSKT